MNNLQINLYSTIIEYNNLDIPNTHQKLFDAETKCRFCHCTHADTTFKKKAHVISETLGNISLISNYECDKCNKLFGLKFEDSFGKFILPQKLISQTFGKKNTMKIKSFPSSNSFIKINKNKPISSTLPNTRALLVDNANNRILTFNAQDNTLTIKYLIQPYNPYYVYQALVKMGLSVMPYSEYLSCTKTIAIFQKILNASNYPDEILKSKANCGMLFFFQGINPLNGVATKLLKRNYATNPNKFPSYLFSISFSNFIITIPILSDLDYDNPNFSPSKFTIRNPKFTSFEILNFETTRKDYSCTFNCEVYPLSKNLFKALKTDLRKNKHIE